MSKELTTLQQTFMDRLREEGIQNRTSIIRELKYTSFYRDRQNPNSALAKALDEYEKEMMTDIGVKKSGNLEAVVKMRDDAINRGDFKNGIAAAKLLADMMGHLAPKKKVNTNIKVETIVDLTKPVKTDEFGDNVYDIDAEVIEEG